MKIFGTVGLEELARDVLLLISELASTTMMQFKSWMKRLLHLMEWTFLMILKMKRLFSRRKERLNFGCK